MVFAGRMWDGFSTRPLPDRDGLRIPPTYPAAAETDVTVIHDHGLPGRDRSELLREGEMRAPAVERRDRRGDVRGARAHARLDLDRARRRLAGDPMHLLRDQLVAPARGCRPHGDPFRERIDIDHVRPVRRA